MRLGTVPYLNAQPLIEGLAERPDVTLETDVPARLAARLRDGEFDAALVSAVELFRDPPLSWVPGIGIASHGPVRSIRLYLRTAPEAIKTVALDTSSLSAAAMTRVCLAEFLQLPSVELIASDPDEPLEAVDADAILRIGDRALQIDPGHRSVIDLGELWTEETGRPFVYALWLVPPGTPAEPLTSTLLGACESGWNRRATLGRHFALRHALRPELCVEYLLRSIHHEIDDEALEGLALFGRLAHKHGLVDRPELPPPLA